MPLGFSSRRLRAPPPMVQARPGPVPIARHLRSLTPIPGPARSSTGLQRLGREALHRLPGRAAHAHGEGAAAQAARFHHQVHADRIHHHRPGGMDRPSAGPDAGMRLQRGDGQGPADHLRARSRGHLRFARDGPAQHRGGGHVRAVRCGWGDGRSDQLQGDGFEADLEGRGGESRVGQIVREHVPESDLPEISDG